jgi:SAM-dependent methyltransferase
MEAQLNTATSHPRAAYHEMMAIFGVGDLHPGGIAATEFLLGELEKAKPSTILEVGAGAGFTTARMIKRGWRVTPIEPSTVMCQRLEARCGIAVHRGTFESFDDGGNRYDAVIGEGVFYGLEPQGSVTKIRRLLRPGGLLAFSDMVWTGAAKADVVTFIHDLTKQAFGIPMAPSDVVAWSNWRSALFAAGFREVVTKSIEPAAFDPEQRVRQARVALGLVRHPGLLPLYLTYRSYRRINWAPPGWLESWMSVWELSGE